jgi:hypothetical protein
VTCGGLMFDRRGKSARIAERKTGHGIEKREEKKK